MRRYLLICLIIFLIVVSYLYIDYCTSFNLLRKKDYNAYINVSDKEIYINDEEFNIKAINMVSVKGGSKREDYSISYNEYLEYFKLIQDMGLNTIKVYNIESTNFYKAFKYYNEHGGNLYLIQGIDIGNYEKNNKYDYYESENKDDLLKNIKTAVDVINGKRIIFDNKEYASGLYRYDVSDWTIGYLIGTEWNYMTVEYTNQNNADFKKYKGKYLYATDESTAFESFLAEVGDKLIDYETNKYGIQRFVSFGITPLTDPFSYSEDIKDYYKKVTNIELNHIGINKGYKSGLILSLQCFDDYPDYSLLMDTNDDAYMNYMRKVNDNSIYPVMISEFGFSTSRSTGINEEEQGNLIVESIEKIKNAGIKHYALYEWQDEWTATSWNTLYSSDITNLSKWFDVDTLAKSYGIYKYDTSIGYNITIDGDESDWKDINYSFKTDKYDVKTNFNLEGLTMLIHYKSNNTSDTLYIPIKVTDDSGSENSSIGSLAFNDKVNFLVEVNGSDFAKVMVQEYYNPIKALYGKGVYSHDYFEKKNRIDKNSNNFDDIKLITSIYKLNRSNNNYEIINEYETIDIGTLRYGNEENDSLTDYSIKDDYLEIRIPYHLLNFNDPYTFKVYDDIYKNYGIESQKINSIKIGIGNANDNISLYDIKLTSLKKEKYNGYLKKSYYIIKEYLMEE